MYPRLPTPGTTIRSMRSVAKYGARSATSPPTRTTVPSRPTRQARRRVEPTNIGSSLFIRSIRWIFRMEGLERARARELELELEPAELELEPEQALEPAEREQELEPAEREQELEPAEREPVREPAGLEPVREREPRRSATSSRRKPMQAGWPRRWCARPVRRRRTRRASPSRSATM